MERDIPAARLRPGLFVVSAGQGTFEDPILRIGRVVESDAEVQRILATGADTIRIDEARSRSGQPEAAQQPLPGDGCALEDQAEAFTARLRILSRSYAQALKAMHHVLEDVRLRRDFDPAPLEEPLDDMVARAFGSPDCAVCLTVIHHSGRLAEHSVNVALLAAAFGSHLGLTRAKAKTIAAAGMFHDIGKILVERNILNKPGRLNVEEFRAVKRHPSVGCLMLSGKGLNPLIPRMVLEHHERVDGSGYPQGLRYDEVSPFSRIISLADAYDAMTSQRPYKPALSPDKALRVMHRDRGAYFGASELDGFIRFLGATPPGSLVRLADGHHGVVLVSGGNGAAPLVRIVLDRRMRPIHSRVGFAGGPDMPSVAECLCAAREGVNVERFLA